MSKMIRVVVCLFALLLAAPALAQLPGGHEANIAVADKQFMVPLRESDPQVSIAKFTLIGLGFTIGGPILLVILQWFMKRAERREDYARQDLVAERQEAAARAAKESADKLVQVTQQSNRELAANQGQMKGQLAQIHTLGNSTLTLTLKALLASGEAQLVDKLEAIAARRSAGQEPSAAALASVAELENSIKSQKEALEERRIATEAAAKEKSDTDKTIEHSMVIGAAADTMANAAQSMEHTADKAAVTADKIIAKTGGTPEAR